MTENASSLARTTILAIDSTAGREGPLGKEQHIKKWSDVYRAIHKRLQTGYGSDMADLLASCAESGDTYSALSRRRQRNGLLRFFRRLGRSFPGSVNGEVRADALDQALKCIADDAGVSADELRSVLTLYVDPADGEDSQPICGSIPLCFDCPLTPICRFYGRKPPINRLPEEERPRERLIADGPQALTNAELLAIIIRSGVPGSSAIDLARQLITESGDLRTLSRKSVGELRRNGIGPAKAAQIRAALEIGSRLAAEGALRPGQAFRRSRDVFDRYHTKLRDLKKESFHILLLDVKNRLIRDGEVSVGNLSSSLVHPREVFRDAIREAANGVIFVHNHPTGDPTPSSEDKEITNRLKHAADIIGIKVLDHIIVGEGRYVSFADEGML